ncbi:hypothetical protein EDC01DRAFT_620784 [Geopyxis carbonaria]|nr:hypothetical protein EDC01DRAFT_620784 [Geopyxis carbonaria]
MAAPPEDAATVLDAFISDVSNLPAELSHLYEEIRARDVQLQAHHNTFVSRDGALQKHIRTHGSHDTTLAKEAVYVDQARKNLRRVAELQDEKLELAKKALQLVDKHSRRLDQRIADLVRDGVMAADAMTPAPPPSNLPAASQAVRVRLAESAVGERDGKRVKLNSGAPETPGVGGQVGGMTPASRAGTPSGHSGTRKTGRKKPPVRRVVDDDGGDEEVDGDNDGDDKRLYCMCQQVSYGSMVGCDDKDCPFEWFHWGCVGLTAEPSGKWYCPECTVRRERERKKNTAA